jgi:hypothetical protein
MKRGFLLFLIALCLCGVDELTANDKPDFIAADITVKADQFIHIKLQNKSTFNYSITPELKEKIFLTIYINNIKRAEYKIKYIDPKLFKPKGTILFRTNFRVQKGLNIKVQINRLKVIPESDFLNNQLIKQFNDPMAWGTYMLRNSFVSVFIHCRVVARMNPFRFEMMHRTPGNPTTVNREHQHGAKWKFLCILINGDEK